MRNEDTASAAAQCASDEGSAVTRPPPQSCASEDDAPGDLGSSLDRPARRRRRGGERRKKGRVRATAKDDALARQSPIARAVLGAERSMELMKVLLFASKDLRHWNRLSSVSKAWRSRVRQLRLPNSSKGYWPSRARFIDADMAMKQMLSPCTVNLAKI